ncbi:hypothetical protein SH139x_004305 [Planctomycetaceae bacterium SH139]
MAYLIATDEAGYGPKLGPLLIAATCWEFDDSLVPEQAFASLAAGPAGEIKTKLQFADSKQLYQRNRPDPLWQLELPIWLLLRRICCSAGKRKSGPALPSTLAELIQFVAADDLAGLQQQRWFEQLDLPFPLGVAAPHSATLPAEQLPAEQLPAEQLVAADAWLDGGPRLLSLRCRVLDAVRFNAGCQLAGNKATLLSECTLALIRQSIDSLSPSHDSDSIWVICDRHGGRRRYGGLIQQYFPESFPSIIAESATSSRYRCMFGERPLQFEFRTKADQFVPVAAASMLAKYLRERLMSQFNAFWLEQHPVALAPTAGYPQDAARFCQQIASTAQRLGIPAERYTRLR